MDAERDAERVYDVAIVGGGPAGLSAGIWLGRYLHSVVLIDSGDPRNWETRGINGYLGLPNVRPAELRRRGREECRKYDVELVDGFVSRAHAEGDERFVLEYDPLHDKTKAKEDRTGPGAPRAPDDNAPRVGTRRIVARRLLLAIGLKDVWPSPRITGLEQVYGNRAHVCPDCDGFDARGKKTVVIGRGRKAVGMALSLTTWTRDITVCTHGEDCDLDENLAGKLAHLGIPVVEAPIERINFRDGHMRSIHFADGRTLGCEKIFFSIGQYPADDLGAQLGCEREEGGHIVTSRSGGTSVTNVWAAGDITPGAQLGVTAAAEGAVAALAIHKSLVPPERKLDPQPAAEWQEAGTRE
jgi:thioredoxin reductase (NADPH)